MPKYRVTRGTYRREDGTRAEPGDIIEVSEARAERLNPESYERIEESDEEDGADVAPTPVEESTEAEVEVDIAPSPEQESESSGDLPDDWDMLQAMAVVYEGEEVKGNSSQEKIEEFFGDFSDTEIAALKEDAKEHLYDEPSDAE